MEDVQTDVIVLGVTRFWPTAKQTQLLSAFVDVRGI